MEKIKLIIWDLDNTVWDGILAEGEVVVYDYISTFIKNINSRGIVNSICSKNDYEKAKSKLIDLDLWEYFVFPIIEYSPKGDNVCAIIKNMALRPENVLFVDDSKTNLEEVRYYNKGINTLTPEQINDNLLGQKCFQGYINGEKKLDQYKQLERKYEIKKEYTSNEDFLQASNIKVEFINYSDEYFERVLELIEKTNQLNFTKNRMNEKDLRNMVQEDDISTVVVKAEDNYGDYGVIGFYSLKVNHLIHFVFSCRIMNMGIEQYVYRYLGKPEINIMGEVASDLNGCNPSWIELKDNRNNTNTNCSGNIYDVVNEENLIRVFGIGACDLSHSISYFRGLGIDLTFECNEFKGLERAVNVGTEYIRSCIEMNEEEKEFCKTHFYNYINAFKETNIFNENNDIVMLSFHDDMIFKVFTKIDNPNLRVIRVDNPAFGLTSIIENNEILSHDKESKWLKDNGFDEGKYITEERFKSNILWISEHLKNKKIYLINGPEYPYFRNYMVSCPEVYGQIKMINQVIKQVCEERPDKFCLIDINKVVKTREDFTDYVFHLSANASYELYKLIIKTLINNESFEEKFFLSEYIRGRKICAIGNGMKIVKLENLIELYGYSINQVLTEDELYKENNKDLEEKYYLIIDNENISKITEWLAEKGKKPFKDFVVYPEKNEEKLSNDSNKKKEQNEVSSLTWTKVKKKLQNKKIIMWGISRGEGVRIFDKEVGLENLIMAIDVNPCLQGVNIKYFLNTEEQNIPDIIVKSPKCAKSIIEKDNVFIITAMNAYKEIDKNIKELFGNNVEIYSVAEIEGNRRDRFE